MIDRFSNEILLSSKDFSNYRGLILNHKSIQSSLYFLVFLLFSFSHCKIPFITKEKEDNSANLLLLGLAFASSQSQTVQEPRPFRGRSVYSYSSTQGPVVFDWNVDQGFSPLAASNPNTLISSESGRFSIYADGTRFRFIDAGLNLSPHGDHYHVDKSNPLTIDPSHGGVSLDIGGTTAVRAFSYNGKSGFTYANGQIRVIEEKTMVDENAGITINSPSSPPSSHNGIAIWMNEGKLIRSTNGNTINFRSGGTGTNFGTDEGSDQTCTSWGIPAAYRFAQAGNNFSNLNLTYLYDHYLAFPCNSDVLLVKHFDTNATSGAGSYTFVRISTGAKLTVLKSLFVNNNYSLGGRSTRPVFYGNFGSNSETQIFQIQGSTNSIISKTLPSYIGRNVASEEKEGKEILVLDNQGILHVLNAENLETITTKSILPAEAILTGGSAPKLFGTWDAAFILYQTNSGEIFLQEFNIKERVATRKVTLPRLPTDISFHAPRSQGTDYTGPLP